MIQQKDEMTMSSCLVSSRQIHLSRICHVTLCSFSCFCSIISVRHSVQSCLRSSYQSVQPFNPDFAQTSVLPSAKTGRSVRSFRCTCVRIRIRSRSTSFYTQNCSLTRFKPIKDIMSLVLLHKRLQFYVLIVIDILYSNLLIRFFHFIISINLLF